MVERPDLVVDMETITDLMGYSRYLDIEKRFLPDEEIDRKYKLGTIS